MSALLWLADARNHDAPLSALVLGGIALAYDDRLSDWDETVVVWASAEERGPDRGDGPACAIPLAHEAATPDLPRFPLHGVGTFLDL